MVDCCFISKATVLVVDVIAWFAWFYVEYAAMIGESYHLSNDPRQDLQSL